MLTPKIRLFIVSILFLVLACTQVGWILADDGKPVWLMSTTRLNDNSIQLGVLDKNDTYPSYKATFVVIGPDGKLYQAEKQVRTPQDDWGFIIFPNDFKASIQNIKAGLYSWKCMVRGKTVIQGTKFEYRFGKGFIVHDQDLK